MFSNSKMSAQIFLFLNLCMVMQWWWGRGGGGLRSKRGPKNKDHYKKNRKKQLQSAHETLVSVSPSVLCVGCFPIYCVHVECQIAQMRSKVNKAIGLACCVYNTQKNLKKTLKKSDIFPNHRKAGHSSAIL